MMATQADVDRKRTDAFAEGQTLFVKWHKVSAVINHSAFNGVELKLKRANFFMIFA